MSVYAHVQYNSVESNVHAINICKDLDIFMHLSFITFDHYTSLKELTETLSNLKKCMANKSYLFQSFDFLYNRLILLDDTSISKHYAMNKLVKEVKRNSLLLYQDYSISDPVIDLIAKSAKQLMIELQKTTDKIGKNIQICY